MQVSVVKAAETEAQADVMVNFLEGHPSMVFEPTASSANSDQLWDDLAQLLNPLGPPLRSGQAWKRSWQVLKAYMGARSKHIVYSNIGGRARSPLEHRIAVWVNQGRANAEATEEGAPTSAVSQSWAPELIVQEIPGAVPLASARYSSLPMIEFLVTIGDTKLDLMDVPAGAPNLFSLSDKKWEGSPISFHILGTVGVNSGGTQLVLEASHPPIDAAQQLTGDELRISMLNDVYKRWSSTYPDPKLDRMLIYTAMMKIGEYMNTDRK